MQRPNLGDQIRRDSIHSSHHPPRKGTDVSTCDTCVWGQARCGVASQAFICCPAPAHAGGNSCHPPSRQNQAALPQHSTGTLQLSSGGLKDINGIKIVSPASAEHVGPMHQDVPKDLSPEEAPGQGQAGRVHAAARGLASRTSCWGDPQQPPCPCTPISSKYWWDARNRHKAGDEQFAGSGLATVYVKAAASCEHFFYLFISRQLPDRLFLGGGKRAERGQTVPGRLRLRSCAEYPARALGDPGRGVPTGWGGGAAGHGVHTAACLPSSPGRTEAVWGQKRLCSKRGKGLGSTHRA